jgi:hypothetical protein
MNAIWKAISSWFASKGGFTHVAAVVFASLMMAYAAVPQFHTWVLAINSFLPGWLESTVVMLIALYAWYKNNDSAKK